MRTRLKGPAEIKPHSLLQSLNLVIDYLFVEKFNGSGEIRTHDLQVTSPLFINCFTLVIGVSCTRGQ